MHLHRNQKKINILYIIDTLCGEGGTENHLYYLVKHLDRNKFSCSVVSFNIRGAFVDKIRKDGIKVHNVPVARYYTFNAFLRGFELRKIIKDNRIDIVQTFHYKADTFGVVTSRLSGVKHVISSRRDIGDTKKRIHIVVNKICNPLIDHYITVCDAVGERLKVHESVPQSKQTTIYNGVDLNRYEIPGKDVIRRERNALGIREDDFVVGYVANFRPEKNHDVFFEALGKIKNEMKQLKVVVVGDGPTEINCKGYCRDNGMGDIVQFIGRKSDVRNYIAVMDVACLVPGSNEGFSNSILEKMAMGKPMIVTDVGGNTESVVDGENGIVIPPLDSQKLAETILYLFKNPSIREEMGRKSRERAEKLFALDNMIKAHEEFYEKILRNECHVFDIMNVALYRKKVIKNVKAYIRLFAGVALYYTRAIKLLRYLKKISNNEEMIRILAYHDISDKNYLNLHLPSEVFLSHVQYLLEEGYNIITLEEAVNALKKESNEPIPENAVVITFDDVYSSFYKTVFPLVKRFGIPITIFLCTEPLENRTPPFVDALIYAFDNTSKEIIDLTDIGLESYRIRSKLLKEDAIYKINECSKNMDVIDRDSLLACIFSRLGLRFPSKELSKEVLSWDEIIEMGKNGLVEFGAHTMNHPSLSRVALEEVRDEILASKLSIQLKLDKDVQFFAYPYGSANDLNEDVRGIVKGEGLSCGCTLSPGVNRKGDDLYLLKRICVTNQIKPQYLRIFSKAVFALHMLKQ